MRERKETEYVDVDMFIYAVTQKAVLMAKEGHDEDSAVWIPRSQCRFSGTPKPNTNDNVAIADWIAQREGLA